MLPGGRRPPGSDRQSPPPLRPASLEHLPAALGGHPVPKAVGLASTPAVRLVGPLHRLLLVRNPGLGTARPSYRRGPSQSRRAPRGAAVSARAGPLPPPEARDIVGRRSPPCSSRSASRPSPELSTAVDKCVCNSTAREPARCSMPSGPAS
jgi:hypothetical protein